MMAIARIMNREIRVGMQYAPTNENIAALIFPTCEDEMYVVMLKGTEQYLVTKVEETDSETTKNDGKV